MFTSQQGQSTAHISCTVANETSNTNIANLQERLVKLDLRIVTGANHVSETAKAGKPRPDWVEFLGGLRAERTAVAKEIEQLSLTLRIVSPLPLPHIPPPPAIKTKPTPTPTPDHQAKQTRAGLQAKIDTQRANSDASQSAYDLGNLTRDLADVYADDPRMRGVRSAWLRDAAAICRKAGVAITDLPHYQLLPKAVLLEAGIALTVVEGWDAIQGVSSPVKLASVTIVPFSNTTGLAARSSSTGVDAGFTPALPNENISATRQTRDSGFILPANKNESEAA